MNLDDTIVAVSTPAGAGERAVLRLCGPRALAIADRVFTASPGGMSTPSLRGHALCECRTTMSTPTAAWTCHPAGEDAVRALYVSAWPTYTARPGRLAPPATDIAVPATAYVMRAPRSYTRQDVVEFHVGAWPAVVPDLVAGLVAAGARLAEPGEFTFRALLNGRLDLAQAEAVMAVIAAGSETALRAAGQLLGGRLSAEVERLAGRVRAILAQVEADLDFADQDVEPAALARVAADLGDLRRDLADTARRCRAIETYCGEVRLVLAGWPNAGKSSLFNRLLEAERAIVSPAPGTTRDELRARLHAGGLELVLSDTAGLDEARDELAGKVRAKALEAIGRADLVLLCLDATAGAYERTDDLAALVTAPVVVAVTKCDAAPPAAALAYAAARLPGAPAVATSARTGQGLDDLRAALVRAVEGGDVDRASAGPVITARHRAAMETAAVALARAARVARRGAGELAALEMREALEALGRILGRDAGADILGEIFARFCIGK